ncbi:MAG: 50S ribosomal protein L21 [Clostridiales bacterium]|nr:50S ribosomal protein L21 [Clostridiales bacterium]
MYAVMVSGGKQYKVSQGDVINVEKLPVEVGAEITFDEVLFVANDDGTVAAGNPCVAGAKIVGKVVAQDKAEKIIVFKYKPKKDFRKKQGHRQPYTGIQIESIIAE